MDWKPGVALVLLVASAWPIGPRMLPTPEEDGIVAPASPAPQRLKVRTRGVEVDVEAGSPVSVRARIRSVEAPGAQLEDFVTVKLKFGHGDERVACVLAVPAGDTLDGALRRLRVGDDVLLDGHLARIVGPRGFSVETTGRLECDPLGGLWVTDVRPGPAPSR